MCAAAAVCLGATQASALQCTDFVHQKLASTYPTRDYSSLSGNAGTWVNAAVRSAGVMSITTRPFAGAIMVFAGSNDGGRYPTYASFAAGSLGHVALVNSVANASTIYVSQANWRANVVDTNAKVTTGDSWTTASVENTATRQMGVGRYAVAGFINPGNFPTKKK